VLATTTLLPGTAPAREIVARGVVLGGLVEQPGQHGDVDRIGFAPAHRPGSGAVISWSIQPLPWGSLNERFTLWTLRHTNEGPS
jgi:hypothetical protein